MAKQHRKPISKKVRFEVFKRDGFCCLYCGRTPPEVLLELDHVTPVSGGGNNDQDNLVTSCRDCNRGKGARSLNVVPQSLSEKAAEVKEREEQLLEYQKVLDQRRDRLEEETWRVVSILSPRHGDIGRFKEDWFLSIRRFIESLGVHEVIEAAEIANERFRRSEWSGFRYFCGVCWNKIRRKQDGEGT